MSLVIDKILYNPTSVLPNLDYPILKGNIGNTILEGIAQVLSEFGDIDWLINGAYVLNNSTTTCGEKVLKLSDVDRKVREVANGFLAIGLTKNQTVHLVIPNSTNFHVIVFGAWLCEAIVSLGDPQLSVEALKSQILDTKANIIVCYENSMKSVYDALIQLDLLEKIKVIVLELTFRNVNIIFDEKTTFLYFKDFIKKGKNMTQIKTRFNNSLLNDEDVCIIFWSSGTTGMPKGIQHTVKYMRKVFRSFWSLRKVVPVRSTYLTTTCHFHIGGFFTPLNIMDRPITYVFNHGEDMENFGCSELIYREIDSFRPTFMICGSHHLVQLSQNSPCNESLELDSVKTVMPMGSTVPSTLFNDLKKHLKNIECIYNMYGMSEVTGLISSSTDVNNLGVVADGVSVKIVETKNGTLCGPYQVGEIMAKMDFYMKGYLNHPKETDEFFSKDGFIHTGDLGHYDLNGILHFDGRLKELIKYKNNHLFPMEIENIISSHPEVSEVAVFGKPDPIVQEYITAAVVKRSGSNLTEKDIVNLVDKKVEDFKRLRGGVIFLRRLPKNPQGKVQRSRLSEM